MSCHHDTIVIGAGPAGLSAGARLAEMGLDVLLLDEQSRIGGQIFRNIEAAPKDRKILFGKEYAAGQPLAQRFRKSGAAVENSAVVWQVKPDGTIYYSRLGQSKQVRANFIVVATGAMERPVPIPGWTLSSVMGAGAANNLAKEAGLAPSGRVVLAGSGPLLLLEAAQLIKKGVSIAAILETTPKLPHPTAFPHAPKALLRTDFLWKGVSMLLDIKKAGIPHYKGVTHLGAMGKKRVEAAYARYGKKRLHIETDLLLLHFGVIPSTHIFRQMGCKMKWEKNQRYWHPVCNIWGQTSFDRVFAAGDGAVVAGAQAAQLKGELSALEVAHRSGILPAYERDMLAKPLRQALKNDSWPRPFVDAIYSPRPEQFIFDDQTVICRCENITVADLRKAIAEGVHDLNEIKIVTRCGMGPCQGRMCGPPLNELIAAETGLNPDETGLLNIRPPLKPVPLEEIAQMGLDEDLEKNATWLME